MSLNGARLRYVDENGEEVLVPAKGRTFQIGSYFSCDVILEPQAERLICEITCDAFGRVTLLNQSNKDTAIHLNDKIIHGQRSHPLLHGNRITILDKVYTWESHKMSLSEDVAGTPERLPPVEQAPNSCPSLKSHRPQIDKRLTVHNFHYSINSDDEGNTSIESRDQNESHLDEQESLNISAPPSTEMPTCETPKVDLVEATQNKENTATPTTSHRQLLQLCALSDVVITSFSPRETGVKVEKSFTCVRKPTKMGKQTAAASVTMSTPKSVYSTPKGGVLSELNDDSCSRDLMDFCTPSTSKKTKRQSSMYLIDLTTPSKLRPSLKPTPISVDNTDESSDGSPIVIDITKSATPPTPGRSHLAKTPRRPVDAAAATPTRTPQSLMKRALLTSTKKKQIAANQMDRTPVATPNRPSPRRLCRTAPRMPFVTLATPEQKEARRAVFEKNQTPKSIPHKRQSLYLGTPRDNKLSQIRKSLAAAKRSPIVDYSIRLTAKARRTLNSPKSSSPKSGSSKPASPIVRQTINMSQPKCSTPEKLDDSTKDELSRTFTIMNESGEPAEAGSILGSMSALITEEMDNSVASKVLETTLPPTETKEDPSVEDQPSENPETELQPAVANVKSPNKNESKHYENGTQSFVESSQESDHPVDTESTKNDSIQANEKVDIIEDSICEEVHANIPKQLDDDDKLSKVVDICEEESPDIKSSDSVAEEENEEPTSRVETPMIRRSLRRLSVDQKAGVATTPRRGSSTRRGSVGVSNSQAETKTEASKRGTRRASCSALVDTQEASGTPRRKRRLSEQMCTPTRQSKRLMMNTPKSTVQVDDSIGDMGVIVEENDDEKSSVVDDENYGKELPCDEPDNVDYHGLRDLLKTPKNCSTPRFKGLREMMRTPKVPASPIFGNIEELLDNSNIGSTPHHNKTSSASITVSRVAVENRKALEGVLKTPSARNIMVPNEPASAILKSRGDSLAATTEYDLEMTNTTLHLDQIFDDVPSTSVANMEDTEAEINVTALSTASGLDPLKESVSSEAPISVSKLESTGVASRKNDPLTSTTYKTAMQADLELSTFTEEGEATSRPSSLGSNEMSGIQLLDQTSDSMFSEPLIVSGVQSFNVTVDETRALGQTTHQPLEINDIDTDSNVGLTEPLVVSDDDDEAELLEDSKATPKKTTAPEEVSIAYKPEESIASKDTTLNQSKGKQSVKETSVVGETINRENDSLIDEVSLIEVNESVAGDSISTTKDGKSLVIELDSSSDTDAEPTRENDESAAVELTIVESETFPLDSTQEDEVSTCVDQNPDESKSEQAEIVAENPSHPSDPQIKDSLPTEEVLEKSRTAVVALTDEEKESDVSVAPDTIPLDASADTSVLVDEELSTNGDQKPLDSESTNGKTEEDQSEKATGEEVSIPIDSETLPLESITDGLEEEISTSKTAKEDQSVINALPCKELAKEKKTGDDEKENDVSAVVGSEILPFDLTADNSVVEEEQKQIDSELSITTNELSGEPAEDLPVIDALPSEEQAEEKMTRNDAKETAVDPDISPLDSTADSSAIHINPQAELSTNDDQEPSDSEPSTTKKDSKNLEDLSVIDTKLSEETAKTADKLPIYEKLSDATTNNMAVQSLGQDAEPNKIESIFTVTKPEADEVSDPKEPKPEAVANYDNTAEKPKVEPEQTTLEVPCVDDTEIQKGDAEELPTSASATPDGAVFETPAPSIQDVEVVSPTEVPAVEALASPSPSPANIEADETSAKKDAHPIDTAQEERKESSIVIIQENNKEDAVEPEIMEDVNPCGDQETKGDESKILATEEESEADKTQVESLCEAESDQKKPTIGQLSTSESASVAAAEKSPLQEVDPSEESNAADITAGDQKERDLPAIDDLAVTEISEEEVNVNTTDVMDDSTSLKTTQSCSQEPVSPKVVPVADNLVDEGKSLNSSSLIMESFTEQPKPASTEGNPICPPENATIQGESEDEVNQLDQSNKAEDVSEDSVVTETDPEVVATSEEISAQQEELKPIEESSDRLNKSNEVEEAFIDVAAKESSKEQTSQIIPATTAEDSLTHDSESVKDDSVTEKPGEKCQDEPLAEILESSPPLESLASSDVVENSEISTTEAPDANKAVGGTQEASATVTSSNQADTVCGNESSRESESAQDKPQADESSSSDTKSEGKSRECERQQTEEAVQEIPFTSPKAEVVVLDDLVSATDNGVKSLSETEHSSIREKAKEVVKNPSVTDDEVLPEELAEGTSAHISESNTCTGEQPEPDDHHVNKKSPNQRTIQTAAVKEGSDIIDLSYDSSSESPPVEEDGNPAPMPASEADVSVSIEETLPSVDSKKTKVEDIPEEGATIAEDRNTVKEVFDTIDLSDDSDSQEDHNPAHSTASEAEAPVPIKETLPTENPRETKVEDVPKESAPIAEDRNRKVSDIIDLRDDSSSESPSIKDHNIDPVPAAEGDAPEETLPTVDSQDAKVEEGTPIAKDQKATNGPDSDANASVSVIETIATQDPNDAKIEHVSDELQNGAPAAPATNQGERAEKPQEVEAAEISSISESVANVEQDEKSQQKSKVEDFTSSSAISTEKVQSSEEVSSSVDLLSEQIQDVETSNKEASYSEHKQEDKPAAPSISSLDPEKSVDHMEPSTEPSVSTMKASHTEPSNKEEIKPEKRATRKGSAFMETPADDAMGRSSRRARKPSAEAAEVNSNDIHEKPKRRVLRKASAEEPEPMTQIQDQKEDNKKEEVLEVIPEEAHSSRDNEPQKEAVSDKMQQEDALEKPKRRARKPSEEVKSADILEKPKRRARKASAEVPEPKVHIEKKKKEPKEEEQAHSSKINEHHEPEKGADSSQQQEVERKEEPVQNKMETPEEPDDQKELPKEEGEELKKTEDTKKVENVTSRTERPKRRGRKASAEETETTSGKKPKIDDQLEVIEEKDTATSTSTQIEQEEEIHKTERPKRRGRKASAEDVPASEAVPKSIEEEDKESKAISTVDEEPEDVPTEGRSRRRGRKPSKNEVVEATAASQPKSSNGNAEKPLENASEDQPSNLTEPNGPQKRTRKSSEFVPAEMQGSAKDTDHTERPKRRGRKPSVDIEHVVQDVPDKPRRRGRTPADPEKQSSGEAKEDEPDKKSHRRTARKPSAETVDAVAHNIEVEQLKDIEEVAEPEPEPEAATATATPLTEEEEPKTRRRGRKLPSKNTAEVGHSRLRGRKATEDETPKSEDPVEGEANVEEEQHNMVPADSDKKVQELPADAVEVPAAETKTKRRVRKASANVDEGTAVAKKTATRRGRKESTQNDDNGQEKIDLQQVPTESVPAVVMSGRISEVATGSEDEVTPRRREGRNMPRKNYDETSDEDKQRSARKPRKPASSKLLAFKDDSTPLSKSQAVEEVETPTNTVSIAEPTSTQRREGRNVPRKNYTEAPDDDKPATSRNRRIRNLSAKALELIVDTPPRPNTPRGRKVKAAGKDETPAKRASLEAAPPAQVESVAEEEPTPVIVKGRAARRKADDNLSEPVAAPPSKRGVRGQHEESEEQPEAKPVPKNARGKGRKAKVESDLEEDVPTKKARGGTRAKTPVKPPEDKSTTEPEEHSPPTKKGRGGTRAKTPVAVTPEEAATKPEEEPAKKPPARSRARGGAKAVAVPEPEQPTQDLDVEPVLSATTTSRGGRAKKVHFEPTESTAAAAAAAPSAEDAPKRATRSRRK